MANNFQISRNYVYENGTLRYTYQPNAINLPQATKGVNVQTITFTTAEADISVGTLGTPGRVVLHNLEPTTTGKTVNWGIKSSTGGLPKYHKLIAKDMAEAYYGTSDMVLRAKAASGTAIVQVIIWEA